MLTLSLFEKNGKQQVFTRMWSNWNPHTLLVRMYKGVVTVGNSFTVSQKGGRRVRHG